MGTDSSKNQQRSEHKYFEKKKAEQLKYFTKLQGFLENKSD